MTNHTSNIEWMLPIKKKTRILISSGEPAGIGPDLIIKLSQLKLTSDITVIADPELLRQRANLLSIPLNIITVNDSNQDKKCIHPTLKVLPVKLRNKVTPGKPNSANAGYILEMLDIACTACMNHQYDALVTTPLQKSVINDADIVFTGHTEYLSKCCNNAYPVMLLSCSELRVALVTTHLPLREVADQITFDKVKTVLNIVAHDLQFRFGIKKPAITVCGLNPHAGENGHLGNEEQKSIIPVIQQLRKKGFNIIGPLPADTAFRREQRQGTDVYVCMYHDQGLPVLKTLEFDEAVNITLGLPIIRTSVIHGTALPLAGTGKASCRSLIAAINMAEKMILQQRQSSTISTSQNKTTFGEH